MIRWFADLPIERKLRVVIMVPATVAFGIALAMHIATNLLHVRDDLLGTGARLARSAGAAAIARFEAGDLQGASNSLRALGDEPLVSAAEVFLTNDKRAAAFGNIDAPAAAPPREPSGGLVWRGGRLHVTAPVVRDRQVMGFMHIIVLPGALFGDWPGYLIITLAAIAAAVAASYWLAARLQQQISGPIVNLAHTMQRVSSEEDYSLRVEGGSQDEIGSLIDGFNQMLRQIRHRDSRLERYREFLEQQVAERTVNLGNANRGLQRAIDEANRAKDAAERASNAKSEFLARMSHEIRTPMNGVIGILELLQGTELTSRQRRLSQTIARSAEALLHIINDILDFSKIEAGRLELERIEFGLCEALEETIEICAGRAMAKELRLAYVIDPEVPQRVVSDPLRLRQVLINLVGNAVKFTETGEVIVRVKALDDAGRVRFEVTDTGIGIPGNALSHIFNAFSQADSFTTRKYGGTGLGLAICKEILTLMGGEIGVHSAVGSGSTFWFEVRLESPAPPGAIAPSITLPAPTAARASDVSREDDTSVAPRATLPRTAPRILVVEDNPINLEVAVGMLESLGCGAQSAANGRLAVEALVAAHYAAILMDCQMPVMDGLTATAEIRRRQTSAGEPRVPIIALTANAMDGDRDRCLAAGMDDFLSKPFTQQQLAAVLERWVPGRRDLWAPLVDAGVLRNIGALQQPQLLDSLIDLYLRHSPDVVAAIERAAVQRQATALAEAVHSLKSSTANLGGTRLALAAQECEQLLQGGGIAKAGPLIQRILGDYAEFCAALERQRSAHASAA